MNGVKVVATLNGLLGWVTLGLSCLAVFVILTQFERMFGPRADLTAAATLLIILSLGAIGPFSIWAGLTALCKLHEQEERVLAAVQALERTLNKLATSGADTEPDIAAGSQERSLDGPVGPFPDTVTTFPQRMIAAKAVSIYRGDDHPKGSPVAWVPVNGKVEVVSRHGDWVRVKGPFGFEGLVEADALKPLEG